MKRIALCFSGQPRTWAKCYENWKQTFSHLGQIDHFFHFWDYNTNPAFVDHSVGIQHVDVQLSQAEKGDIIQALQPKAHLFESAKDTLRPPRSWVTKPVAEWSRSQFYSIRRAAWLKRQYEIEHNFEYDLVIRMRSDAWFPAPMPQLDPRPNVVYTTHNSYDAQFARFRVGDIFWAADSHTYDQMSNFYRYLNVINTHDITPSLDCPPPELALYPYMKSINLENDVLNDFHVKLMRTPEIVAIMGGLAHYETV